MYLACGKLLPNIMRMSMETNMFTNVSKEVIKIPREL